MYRFVIIRMWAKAIIDLTGYYIRCRQTQRTFQWDLLQHMKWLKTWTAATIQRRKTAITSPMKHLTKWNLKILHLTRRKNFPQALLMASSFFSHLLHGPGKDSLVCVGEISGVFLLKILATTWHTISWTIYGFYLFLLSFRFWCEYFWTFLKNLCSTALCHHKLDLQTFIWIFAGLTLQTWTFVYCGHLFQSSSSLCSMLLDVAPLSCWVSSKLKQLN